MTTRPGPTTAAKADKNGKKHLKPFSGTDAQLDALVAWLQKQTKADTK